MYIFYPTRKQTAIGKKLQTKVAMFVLFIFSVVEKDTSDYICTAMNIREILYLNYVKSLCFLFIFPLAHFPPISIGISCER